MVRREVTPEQARQRLEDLCARSEQCRYDLLRKLSLWGIGSDVAGKIVAHLRRERYVDDCRFAHAYCRDKFRFGRWGRLKIVRGLMEKRIDREVIDDAIDAEIDDEEYVDTLVYILRSKSRMLEEPRSYDGKTKLFRFAASRGFEQSLVIRVINSGIIWQED